MFLEMIRTNGLSAFSCVIGSRRAARVRDRQTHPKRTRLSSSARASLRQPNDCRHARPARPLMVPFRASGLHAPAN